MNFKDLFRYTVSGVSSVVVQFGTLAGLVEYVRVNETFASGFAFVIACVVNYLMLYYWAFASKGSHVTMIFRYSIVMFITLLLNVALFWVLIDIFHVWYLLAQAVATIVAAVFNLILNRYYTFN